MRSFLFNAALVARDVKIHPARPAMIASGLKARLSKRFTMNMVAGLRTSAYAGKIVSVVR
ncbi:MAG: hypothetical protein QW566_02195 [Candidatus Jordarchaeales archaeon]